MPADALTKALPSAKFASMLELLNVGALQAQARIASLSWTRSVLTVMIASLSLLLKGQDGGEAVHPVAHALEAADPYFWIWVVGFVGVIILAWEGAKALFRSRCQRREVQFPTSVRSPGIQELSGTGSGDGSSVEPPQSLLIRGLREGCVGRTRKVRNSKLDLEEFRQIWKHFSRPMGRELQGRRRRVGGGGGLC